MARTESLPWLPSADAWASQHPKPPLWRQALCTHVPTCFPGGPEAPQCLTTISKRSMGCPCQSWGSDFSSPNSTWSESFPGLQMRKQFQGAHSSYGRAGGWGFGAEQLLPARKRAWPRLRGHCCPLPPCWGRRDQERLCRSRLLATQSLSLLGGLGPALSSWNRPTP